MGHIDISATEVVSTPVHECGEKLVSAKGKIKCGTPPESPETKACYHYVRQGVLDRLQRAEESLPDGLSFRLYEGYRSPEFQEKLFEQQLERVLQRKAHSSDEDAYHIASQLVAPTRTLTGETLYPPHSTGGAVDIEIVDRKGQVIDFGMELKDWNSVSPELCAMNASGLSREAIENRAMLLQVMSEAGFVNYSREWWHFSYGDQYWAFMTEQPQAIYGSVVGFLECVSASEDSSI
ncbi:D-alanyl-D-alanine dipeptidase [Vibrio ishigakensis]|uniref:D-alanyl-D-alanine dipeptidase n=1 Tax=Vibrio ishigakensis TaxID=1481914 RepID=A0A0B8NSF1_9VIBR|nr:M15 family metallopeptidase [Vibrio ishigakensis]GAM54078.1 D-alanyl-D-alanine dipeptidase [Vibrio ishigakensis]